MLNVLFKRDLCKQKKKKEKKLTREYSKSIPNMESLFQMTGYVLKNSNCRVIRYNSRTLSLYRRLKS